MCALAIGGDSDSEDGIGFDVFASSTSPSQAREFTS